jgi:hypothetical protein
VIVAVGVAVAVRRRRGIGAQQRAEPAQRERQPLCPVLAHFPTDPRWMAPAGIEAFQAAHRSAHGSERGSARAVEIRLHAGRYGFMQPQHTGYDAVLALRVQAQTLGFLQQQSVDGVSIA